MSTRTTIWAALMGSTILAGRPLAAGPKRYVAGDGRQARGPRTVQSLLGHTRALPLGRKARPRDLGRYPQ